MVKKHKKHVFHLQRAGLLVTLVLALFIVRADAGAVPSTFRNTQVLAYATEMSRGALLSGTNSARAANGLGALALNSALNSSAQSKAQHMMDHDYWAHVAPDGTQPWYFFDQAGYSYIRAGENLAYGFMTSQGAIDGWMNSPTHKANVLGDYADVGFGIVNAPNFQSSGEQTIVVAHYGTSPNSAPPAPAAPVAAAPPPPAAPAAPAQSAPAAQPVAPVETPASLAPQSSDAEQEAKPTETPASTAAPTTTASTASKRVSVLGLLSQGSAPAAALISLIFVSLAVLGYALTHRAAFSHAVYSGEHFIIAHPGVDAGIVGAMTSLILLTTYGFVR